LAPASRDPGPVLGLDIGSNTFSCVALEDSDAGVRVVDDASHVVRLAEDLVPGGPLSARAVARGLAVLGAMAERFRFEERPLRAVGTAALRLTGAPEDFTFLAEPILGVPVEIVDGEAEARLAWRGCLLGLDVGGPRIMVDVGGRSTEVCWDEDGEPKPVSVPLGVVELTQRFLRSDPPAPQEVAAMRLAIREVLAGAVPRGIAGEVVTVAGTATTLAFLELGLERWDRDLVHGARLTSERLEVWLARMAGVDCKARVSAFGVGAGRADVFPAGLAIFAEVMALLGRERFTVSVNGLRVGVALGLLEEVRHGSRSCG
jgi:exopolyphosphatase / guanosine-5'-triphosphate,3'-diphosphate pyrophosphatase